MTSRDEQTTAGMAVVATVLGASALVIMVLIQGPEKWVFAGLAAAGMIAFLVPVLRSIRAGGREN